MLEISLATKFLPGTNLKNDLGCADWRFLLPRLRFDNVLCIGVPALNIINVLSTMSSCVNIVSRDESQLRMPNGGHNPSINSNLAVHTGVLSALPFPNMSIDLIYLSDSSMSIAVFHNQITVRELSRVLKLNGTVYFETQGLLGRFMSQKGLRTLLHQGFNAIDHFWLTPLSGEMRTALPLKARNIANYFFENVLYGQSAKKRALSLMGAGLVKLGLISHIVPRCGVVVHRSYSNDQLMEPPDYLRLLAEKTDIDFSRFSYGLSARGKYNSNKVIFFLFEGSAKKPSVVIKITRAPEFNFRLENEYRALKLLKKNKFVEQNSYPEAVFLGYHNNLAILCQKAVLGTPFRTRTNATPDCLIARNAIEWIVQLGTASANRTVASSIDVSKALSRLYETFIKIYKLSREEEKFLVQQIDFNGYVQKNFPIIFQHGDPGTWNILVSKQNKVIFMDWESGEPQGMPLWDLFYFFRTYASWVSRTHGTRDALNSFIQHFIESSPLGVLLQNTTRRYCDSIGLDKNMVEPLFYTCWIHRALKEAMRLPADSLESGHYVNLLRLTIKNRNAVPLMRLFSL